MTGDDFVNTLYYGDNLEILRRYIPDESVDLIYLDPPFNSNQDYNVLFADKNGTQSSAQIQAFEDTWHWDIHSEAAWQEVVERGGKASDVMQAFRAFLGDNDMMAYLAMMAPRLVELHRVLKPTGSIYLHCDPTASHYLKILMDSVFEPSNYVNEIIWKRTYAHGDAGGQKARHVGRVHDTILYYAKLNGNQFFQPVYQPYDPEYVEEVFKYKDSDGRRWQSLPLDAPGGAAKGNPEYELLGVKRYWRYSEIKMKELYEEGLIYQSKPGTVPRKKGYLDESPGVLVQDIWTDIKKISSRSNERLGYPTQKPESLLQRIIEMSCPEKGIILDPFCGCGTAIAVAQRFNRKWIGIDITHLAISLMKHRLMDSFGELILNQIRVEGEPVSISGAKQLAKDDPYQFQWWSLGLVGARPVDQKKGADKGIDGKLYFFERKEDKKPKQIIFSVKAGKVQVSHIRDLRGVIEREKAQIGVLITMNPPTKPMVKEAAGAGFYSPEGLSGKKYPHIQILTIEDLMGGKSYQAPPFIRHEGGNITFRKAPKKKKGKKHKKRTTGKSLAEFGD